MATVETRFSELRSDDDGTVSGVAMAYGTVAVVGGQAERFEPQAFEFPASGVFLNVQHQRTQPVAKFPDGGLELRDSDTALTMRATLADTTVGRDALTNIKQKILSGLSIEFVALEERFEQGTRIISKALLRAIGIVDVPAYSESIVEARAEVRIEHRQDGPKLTGFFPYNTPITTSDRGRVRKAAWVPDAWKQAFADLNREILLQLGDAGRNQVLASRQAGSVRFKNTEERLEFEADIDRAVQFADDFIRQLESGQIPYTVRPYQSIPPSEVVPKPYRDLPEKGNPGVFIRTFDDVILRSLNIVPRGGAGNVQVRQYEPWL